MSDKNNGGNFGLGEISTIRNILMGEHISQFESSFNELESKLNAQGAAFEEKLTSVQKNYDARLSEMQAQYESKISELESALKEKSEALEGKIITTSGEEQKRLSGLFAKLSEQISNE